MTCVGSVVPQFVFPAPAGINRHLSGGIPVRQGVPRASGDKPGIALAVASVAVCSPRQRG
ncbi:TPA: hypothetical protein G8V61_004636 [Salmonella enterica]|nr:hypothetical protein [Salmonella enterica]